MSELIEIDGIKILDWLLERKKLSSDWVEKYRGAQIVLDDLKDKE